MTGRLPYFLLLCVIFSVPLLLSPLAGEDALPAVMIPGAAVYCAGLAIDVCSTVRFGSPRAVSRMELSPLFSRTCRYGFGPAVAVHIAVEGAVMFLLVPAVVTSAPWAGDSWAAASGAALWALGAAHWAAGARNGTLYRERAVRTCC